MDFDLDIEWLDRLCNEAINQTEDRTSSENFYRPMIPEDNLAALFDYEVQNIPSIEYCNSGTFNSYMTANLGQPSSTNIANEPKKLSNEDILAAFFNQETSLQNDLTRKNSNTEEIEATTTSGNFHRPMNSEENLAALFDYEELSEQNNHSIEYSDSGTANLGEPSSTNIANEPRQHSDENILAALFDNQETSVQNDPRIENSNTERINSDLTVNVIESLPTSIPVEPEPLLNNSVAVPGKKTPIPKFRVRVISEKKDQVGRMKSNKYRCDMCDFTTNFDLYYRSHRFKEHGVIKLAKDKKRPHMRREKRIERAVGLPVMTEDKVCSSGFNQSQRHIVVTSQVFCLLSVEAGI